ncbi:MAG: hypothetical protein ABC595_05825 [Candidatus Methanosuratincola petrocarbonis]
MFNSRRGASVIVSAILLIAVAISSAAVLWSAFSLQGLPQSNVNQVLEDVRIVKVVPVDGGMLVYVMNKGSTKTVIDSIYLESPYGNLDQTFDTLIQLDPGEIKEVFIPKEISLENPVVFKAVTMEGTQSAILVMNESSGAVPSPIIKTGAINFIPYSLTLPNGTTIMLNDTKLQDLDLESVPVSSEEYERDITSGVVPNEDESRSRNADLIQNSSWFDLWQPMNQTPPVHMGIVYGGTVPISGINALILRFDTFQIPQKPNMLEIKFFNWTSNDYANSGPGYKWVDVTESNWNENLTMIVNNPNDFVDAQGNYKFVIEPTHYYLNNGRPKLEVKLDISILTTTTHQLINSTFRFNLPADIDPNNIEKMSISFSYSINYSPVTFDLRAMTATGWEIIMPIEYNGGYDTRVVDFPNPLTNFVVDSTVTVNLHKYVPDAPQFDVSIDEFRLLLTLKS